MYLIIAFSCTEVVPFTSMFNEVCFICSKQRHNTLWRSVSTGKLNDDSGTGQGTGKGAGPGEEEERRGRSSTYSASGPMDGDGEEEGGGGGAVWRPRSWSPEDGPGELLLKARGLGGEFCDIVNIVKEKEMERMLLRKRKRWRESCKEIEGGRNLELSSNVSAHNADSSDEEESSSENSLAGCGPDEYPSYDDDGFQDGFQDGTFPQAWEDVYDVSSRSADSLDDGAIPGGTAGSSLGAGGGTSGAASYGSGARGIELLSYRTGVEFVPEPTSTPGNLGASGMSLAQGEIPDEESDVEDFVAEDRSGKSQRGMYDVTMLAGFNHQYLPCIHTEDRAEDDDDDSEENLELVHPDLKMPLMQAQFRKQARIARVLQFSLRKEHEERARIVMAEQQQQQLKRKSEKQRRKKRRTHSASSSNIKTRPDDFWIKEIPPSPGNDLDTELQKSPQSLALASGVSHSISPQMPDLEASESQEHPHSDSGSVRSLPGSVGSVPGSIAIPGSVTGNISGSGSINEDKVLWSQIGISHYEKEAIPWNPGTVKQTTMSLENKYRGGIGGVSSGTNSTSPETSDSGKMDAKDSTALASSGGSETEKGEVEEIAPVGGLYASEDIALPPGIVSRTKMEIEERTR
jgi:hypothetical protein